MSNELSALLSDGNDETQELRAKYGSRGALSQAFAEYADGLQDLFDELAQEERTIAADFRQARYAD
ncbi:hypothetical protein [Ectothiorhodospira shaposhnikovii]|uniref:hypothetical protein n=1 Tax=Ectothiorhodospira shaposhnikovii TaxID=1054 RepID=UPI001EE94A66|nr:hypothetical protein [Ectothiorhodospira shaposhnikovii]MCG5512822.1 hypothetical protein [Ectothiorhodospira shaposhnikovii]